MTIKQTTEIVRTTRRAVTLDETQVAEVLREWARKKHQMRDAEVDFDISYGGFLNHVELFEIKTERETE